jgi:adenosylcobinamide kinase/adenosylcobinamide-phosphate guanylyltransferase
MGQVILVLGGVRSGKSAYAQELAQQMGGQQVLFVATAEAGDAEMTRRITAHRQSRPARWRTLETCQEVGPAIATHVGDARVVVVDCLTLLVSNVMLGLGETPESSAAEDAVQAEIQALVRACQACTACCIVVSNEVGLGLVPDNPLGRLYRDLLGQANQALAAHAQAVYLMVAGLPVELKALALPRSAGAAHSG